MPVLAIDAHLALRSVDGDVGEGGANRERIGRTCAPDGTGKEVHRKIGGFSVGRRGTSLREAASVRCDEGQVGRGLDTLEIDA